MIAPLVELSSTKVGTNNRAFSNLPVAEQHLIIAQKMQEQLGDQIKAAKVNEGTKAALGKPGRGALFGT